jgi:3-oxoacyl-[acyl-carrier-protein] synthase-3
MNSKRLKVKIAGVGHYVPERIVSSSELEERLGLPQGSISKGGAGINERRFAADYQAPSDLAVEASKDALQSSETKIEDVDLIIFAATTGDVTIPSTASIIQNKFGVYGCATMDIKDICLSFLRGLEIASSFIRIGLYNTILVVSAEMTSRWVNWNDPKSCILFGDGAGATVLKPANDSEDNDFLGSYFATDSRGGNSITIPGCGTKYHPNLESTTKEMNLFRMQPIDTYKFALKIAEPCVQNILNRSGCKIEDITLIIPHQASLHGVKGFMKKAGVSLSKVYLNLNRYGNTASASIPIALSEAVKEGKIKRGDKIMLIGTGAGFSYGGIVISF